MIRFDLPTETTTYALRHIATSMMALPLMLRKSRQLHYPATRPQLLNTYAHAYPKDPREIPDLFALIRHQRKIAIFSLAALGPHR
ncbi:MAG: hypothetical protein ACP5O0_00855 [Acidimicrobiales bacterium]